MSISAWQWTAALGLATVMHGAVFALAARNGDDMARGIGAPSQDMGTAMISLDGQSELLQELEPEQPLSVQEPVDPAEEQEAAEPVVEAALSDELAPEIEPISDSAVALAIPTKAIEEPVEQKTEAVEIKPKKSKAKKKKKTQKNKLASVRKGGGSNGRKANVSGSAAFSSYSGRVRARLAGRTNKSGSKGTVVVRFTIISSGSVSSASVVRGATGTLNSAALRAVRAGFPPIPPGLPRSISITIPIRFN